MDAMSTWPMPIMQLRMGLMLTARLQLAMLLIVLESRARPPLAEPAVEAALEHFQNFLKGRQLVDVLLQMREINLPRISTLGHPKIKFVHSKSGLVNLASSNMQGLC